MLGEDSVSPHTLGALNNCSLARAEEAYALRTAQAALALGLGAFPTSLKVRRCRLTPS
jgi:hypothetical protein